MKRNTSRRAINQYVRKEKRRKTEANGTEKGIENTIWKEAKRTYDSIQYKPKGKRPEGIRNEETEIKTTAET